MVVSRKGGDGSGFQADPGTRSGPGPGPDPETSRASGPTCGSGRRLHLSSSASLDPSLPFLWSTWTPTGGGPPDGHPMDLDLLVADEQT